MSAMPQCRLRRATHLSRVVTALSRASLAAASSAVLAAMRPRSEGSAEPGSGAPPLVRTRPDTGVAGEATLAATAAATARASGTREALMAAGQSAQCGQQVGPARFFAGSESSARLSLWISGRGAAGMLR